MKQIERLHQRRKKLIAELEAVRREIGEHVGRDYAKKMNAQTAHNRKRENMALRLKRSGKDAREIAEAIGTSQQRATQICKIAERNERMKRTDPFFGLPNPVRWRIKDAEILTPKDLGDVLSNQASSDRMGFGVAYALVICTWLGMKLPEWLAIKASKQKRQ